MLSDVDAAYLAAFVDGEGCIFIDKEPKAHRLRVSIGNTFPGIMDWVYFVVGHGSISKKKKRESHHKDMWVWSLSGRRAINFLYQIYPYLRIKKLQAEVAFEFGETVKNEVISDDIMMFRTELKHKMTALNN